MLPDIPVSLADLTTFYAVATLIIAAAEWPVSLRRKHEQLQQLRQLRQRQFAIELTAIAGLRIPLRWRTP